MVQPRRKRLFVLSVAASCGIAAAGSIAVQHSDKATTPIALQQAVDDVSASAATRRLAPVWESAWQQVGWNDGSQSSVSITGVAGTPDNATAPRQPVVTAVPRRTSTATKLGATAPLANTGAPNAPGTADPVPPPLSGGTAFAPFTIPASALTATPAATDSADDKSVGAGPAAPVVRVVPAPRMADLSVLDVGPTVDRGSEEAALDEQSEEDAAQQAGTPRATAPSTPTVRIAQSPAAAPAGAPSVGNASNTRELTSGSSTTAGDPTKELFGPPPVPRGGSPMSRGMARRLAKAAQAPWRRPTVGRDSAVPAPPWTPSTSVEPGQDVPAANVAKAAVTPEPSEGTAPDVDPAQSASRVAIPNPSGVFFAGPTQTADADATQDPAPAAAVGLSTPKSIVAGPPEGAPTAPPVVAAVRPAVRGPAALADTRDESQGNASSPTAKASAIPAKPGLNQPQSEQITARPPAAVPQRPLMRPARDVAASSAGGYAGTRAVPPQPLAPWAAPPTTRPGAGMLEPRPAQTFAQNGGQPNVQPMPGAAQGQVAGRPMAGPPRIAAATAPAAGPNVSMAGVDPNRAAQSMGQPRSQAIAPQSMPLAQVPPVRPPYLVVVAARAQEHIEYGFSLAERGATYSAESEFSDALLLVAQALDAAENTRSHSEAMTAGLRALREADDFVPRDSVEPQIDQVVATHRTPVLKRATSLQMPLLAAMQDYYTYAQYQLSVAGGHEPTAAAALYGLARLQPVLVGASDAKKMMAGPKALALHQAALVVDPTNFAAANEMGVLLARYGQWPEAQAAFLQSVCIAPQPQIWRNLAVSYEMLGDMNAARNAMGRYEMARQQNQSNTIGGGDRPSVKFLDTEKFVQASGGPEPGDMSYVQNRAEQGGATPIQQATARQLVPSQPQAQAQPATPPASNQEYPIGWLKSKFSAARAKTAQQQSGGTQGQLR